MTLRTVVHADAHAGYPFALVLEVRYVLGAGSLDVALRARNVGTAAAPVSLGWHPTFASPGTARSTRWSSPCRPVAPS